MSFPYHRKVTLTNSPDLLNIRYLDEGCVDMTRRMHRNGIAIDIERLDSITCDLMRLEDEYKRQIRAQLTVEKSNATLQPLFKQAVENEKFSEKLTALDAQSPAAPGQAEKKLP